MPQFGRFPKIIAAVAVALLGLGCSGQIDGAGSSGNGGPGSPGPGPGPGKKPKPGDPVKPDDPTKTPEPSDKDPGRSLFRRLSRLEYNNTVRDLLGDSSAPASAFPPDQQSAESGFVTGNPVASADAAYLLEATETLAASAMKRLETLLPGGAVPTAPADQDKAAKDFIAQFGKRAFRRPLTQDESASLNAFYTAQRKEADFPNAMRMVIAAVLLSPQFLYRWEVTPQTAIRDGDLLRYNSYEMASRLSYLLWSSMPDNDGFAAADGNKLQTPQQIEAEARRLLKSDRAKGALADFFVQWLGMKDLAVAEKQPKFKFTPQLAQSMIDETAAFSADVVIGGDGKLATLFTSTAATLDPAMAALYGASGNALDAKQRAGILTRAGFLTAQADNIDSHPVKRGHVILERILCKELDPPDIEIPMPKAPSPDLSTRERYAEHGQAMCAKGCHDILDPLGFAFEHYDAIGTYRTMDGGKAVDAAGTVTLDEKAQTFNDAIEFSQLLAGSKQVANCMATQFLRYSLRRKETKGDAASMAEAVDAFSKQSNNLRELIVAMTKTRAFTHRTPSIGEVLP